MKDTSLESTSQGGTVALRSVGAWFLWLGSVTGVVSATLDVVDAGRTGRPVPEMVTVALAGAALSILLAGLAAPLAAGLAALMRGWAIAMQIRRIRPVLALLAGTGLAWWLTDPLRRRLSMIYVLFCVGTGIAFAVASWLASKRAAVPEVMASLLLAIAGISIALAIPVDSYDELQDLAVVIGVAGVMAASTALFAYLKHSRVTPLVGGAALLAAVGALVALESVSPQWRAAVHNQQRGAARVARALRAILDLDRDGYSPVLQGGDCDDLDASVHPLARDIPGGGDQNCNGVDPPVVGTPAERGLDRPVGEAALASDAVDRVLLITVDCWRADALDPGLMPEVSAFARGGLAFERLYAAGSSTLESLPMVVGIGPRGPWVAEIAARSGIRVDSVIAGPVPTTLWGFRRRRTVPEGAEAATNVALEVIDAAAPGRQLLWVHYFDLHALHQYRGESSIPSLPAHLPASYRVAARHIDRAIGRLLNELDRRGLLGRTMVVITGDHGEGLGAHGVPNHVQSGFEEVLRVPGILRGPGVPATSVPYLASHRDLPSTLLGSFGLAADAAAAEHFGRSWLRLRRIPRRPLHTFVVARSARRVSGRLASAMLGVLVTDRYKLVAGLEDGLFELYDLVDDPREQRDLASTEDDLRQRLWRQLALAWDLDYQAGDVKGPK